LGWKGILAHSKTWLVLTLGIVVLCQTKIFLLRAEMPELNASAPSPVYGPGVFVYSAYCVAAFAVLIFSYGRDLRNTTGAEYAELSFILIGAIGATSFALLLSFVLDYFLGPYRAILFAPFRMIILSLVMGLRDCDS
jgi:hypothetical protein